MAIELPGAGTVFVPDVPSSVRQVSPELYEWAQRLRAAVQDGFRGQFNNSLLISTAMNAGTSGTFTISSGGSIIVTSGIVLTVTS